MNRPRPHLALLVLAASILGIAAATLTALPGQAAESASTHFLCLPCGEGGGADLLNNLVLFLPLGLSLAALGLPLLQAAAAGLALSGSAEALQYAVIAGRDASASDLIANTAGTAIGWAIMVYRGRWLRPSPRNAGRLLRTWTAIAAAAVLFSQWALLPDLPDGPWHGQWAESRPEPGLYPGRVADVQMGTARVPHGLIPDSLQRALRQGAQDTVRISATVVTGPVALLPRRILSLGSANGPFLRLGTAGGDLYFGLRTNGAAFRLRAPVFRVTGGLTAAEGKVVHIGGEYVSGHARVWSRGAVSQIADVRLGWMDPWVLLWPAPVPDALGIWLLRLGTLGMLLGPFWLWRPLAGLHSARTPLPSAELDT